MYQIERRKNKSNILVRECITQALFFLLEKKDFEEISITDIIKKAGVSRMGFYRNFSTKENVVESYILDIFVETVDEIQSKRKLDFRIENIMQTTLENFKRHSTQIKLFLSKKMDWLLYNCYCKAFQSLNSSKNNSRIREYSNQMFVGELFSLEMSWVRNGMKESPERLSKIYYYILSQRAKTSNKI